MPNKTAILTLVLTLALVACSGPQAQIGFSGSLDNPSLAVQQTNSVQAGITITPQNGVTGTLSLALKDAPQGVGLSPATVTLVGKDPIQQSITLSVGALVAVGSYKPSLELSLGSARQSLPFTLNVTEGTGSLNLNITAGAGVTPDVAVSGPGNFSRKLNSTGTQTLSNLIPGSYTVSAAEVSAAGFTHKAGVSGSSVTIEIGKTAQASVAYAVASGSLEIKLGGLPLGLPGNIAISGPAGFSAQVGLSLTLTGLAPGNYTLTPNEVVDNLQNQFVTGIHYTASPVSASVSLGQTAAAAVNYTPGAPIMRGLVATPTFGKSNDTTFDLHWAADNAESFRLEVDSTKAVLANGQPYTGPINLQSGSATISTAINTENFDRNFRITVSALPVAGGGAADSRFVEINQLQDSARMFVSSLFDDFGKNQTALTVQRGTTQTPRLRVEGFSKQASIGGSGTVEFSAVGPGSASTPNPQDLAALLGFPRKVAFTNPGGVNFFVQFPFTPSASVVPGLYTITLTTIPDAPTNARTTSTSFILLVL